MNSLADSLYNVYSEKKTARELWESLDQKYKTEDAGAKKFIVGKFLDYKMIDSKSVISQVQELQVLLHEIHTEGMVLSETFQVAAIIEKLPPTWNDFKNYLKHKRKEMNVEELIIRLPNIVEKKKNSKAKRFAGGGFKLGTNKDTFKKKFLGKCYNCGGLGHKSSECKKPKRNRETNLFEDISKEVSNMDLCAVISEVNMVVSNPREWWINTGATRHIFYDKDIFATLDESENGEKLFMGNSATSDIKGQGKVILKMTSGKELTLNNVFKDEAIEKFVHYKSKAENQLDKKIKVLRSDRGGEYESPFAEFGSQHGIRHERTAPYSPQQNGVAERKNRTLKDMMNALLLSTGLSQNMWGEAVLTANYLLNKEEPGSSKRSHKTMKQEVNHEVEPRRSKRARIEKSFGPDFITFMMESEPQSFNEAVNSSEGPQWKEAINSEIESILQNHHTWELVDLPTGSKPLGSKWIFKRKMKSDGTIDKYKARLVIKGYRQCEGLDYFDTYSPVTRINSIRVILAIAALRNLEVHQMDDTKNGYVILCLYVDDMLIIGSNDKMIQSTKKLLNSKFDMKDLGLAEVILGIKIHKTSEGMVLSQSHYVDKILEKFNKDDSALARTPINTSQHLSKNRDSRVIQELTTGKQLSDCKGGAAIAWKSSKQTVIARSTMESEFIALDKCAEEAEWLRLFLENVPGWVKPVPAICIHCDSQLYEQSFGVHSCLGMKKRAEEAESKGVAKRKNRTLKEMMNALLLSSGLSQNMWGEAVLTANYILNKVPRKKQDKISYEIWKGRTPSYQYLRVWGCLAKVVVPTPKKVKVEPKTVDCIFIGYAHNSSAYHYIVYESQIPDIHKNTIMESRNASFFENVFPCKSKEEPGSSKRSHETIEQEVNHEVEPRQSKRARIEKSFGPDFITFIMETEPQSFNEAVNSSEGPQ
ncbi:uncharacterized protein [Henckelia pumila]|uniref:uncharacterized protein n=1 Tax=Henckelia pumila TaxID=405737 RepID=UPI003C6E0864